jgi:hypothetical protein
MVTVHDVRAWAMSLPRTEEHLILVIALGHAWPTAAPRP